MRRGSPKAVELRQVRRMLNDLHKLEHELRTALCSCKKALHKRSARCALLRDPTPSRRTWRGGLYVRTLHGVRGVTGRGSAHELGPCASKKRVTIVAVGSKQQ